MGKVTYKEPSNNFEKMSSLPKGSSLRSSIGREGDVKEFYYLSIENLIPYHKQARKYFSEKEINELSNTIKSHGIQSPLLVISSEIYPNKYEIISGERRYKAALKVGLEKLPCIIIDPLDAEEIALIENIQRADLHPVELGDSLQSLLSSSPRGDLTKLAEKLGKSHSTISNYLSYSRIPKEIKAYLIENNIKSRDILRKILKASNISEMQKILGIKDNQPSKNVKQSILRISLDEGKLQIQSNRIEEIINIEILQLMEKELENLLDKIKMKLNHK